MPSESLPGMISRLLAECANQAAVLSTPSAIASLKARGEFCSLEANFYANIREYLRIVQGGHSNITRPLDAALAEILALAQEELPDRERHLKERAVAFLRLMEEESVN